MFNKYIFTYIFSLTHYRDLQNISLTNKNTNLLCKDHVWKKKCQNEFPILYEQLPISYKIFLWQRVYFHLKRMFKIENRIIVSNDLNVDDLSGHRQICKYLPILNDWFYFDVSTIILAKLIKRGAHFNKEDRIFVLKCLYKFDNRTYKFKIVYYMKNYNFYICSSMHQYSKLYKKHNSDIINYLLNTYLNDCTIINKYDTVLYTTTNKMWSPYILNLDFRQDYDFYYLPNEIVYYDENIYFLEYVNIQLYNLNEYVLMDKEYIENLSQNNMDIFEYVFCYTDGRYIRFNGSPDDNLFKDKNRYNNIFISYLSKLSLIYTDILDIQDLNNKKLYWSKCGNINGTLFVIYGYNEDTNVYIKANAKSDKMDCLIKYLKDYFSNKHKSKYTIDIRHYI